MWWNVFSWHLFCRTLGLCKPDVSLLSLYYCLISRVQILVNYPQIIRIIERIFLTQTCTYSSEGLYDHPLVVIGACGRLKNVQENLLEEHLQRETTWEQEQQPYNTAAHVAGWGHVLPTSESDSITPRWQNVTALPGLPHIISVSCWLHWQIYQSI